MTLQSARKPKHPKPDVFRYVDYRAFLKDWLSFLKKERRALASAVAAAAGLSGGYLSMVVAGKRELTLESALRLLPHLQLGKTEQNYLENLIRLSLLEPGASRVGAAKRLRRYSSFRKNHGENAVFFQYASNWYYAAIREMASLPDFDENPEAIRSRLKGKATIGEIKEALKFLEQHGFIRRDEKGALVSTQETLHARGLLYWTALSQFHKDMFDQASHSIENTEPAERDLQGYTLTMSPRRFKKAQAILGKALDELEKLATEEEPVDSVYQVQIAMFPLTQKSAGKREGEGEGS